MKKEIHQDQPIAASEIDIIFMSSFNLISFSPTRARTHDAKGNRKPMVRSRGA
jgi:hypothetical protein